MTVSTGRSKWGHAPLISFDQQISTEDTNEILSHLARWHLDLLSEAGWAAGGTFIADCLTSGDFPALCDYGPDVLDLNAHDYYHLTQCIAFFKKRDDIKLGVDPEAVAVSKFRDAERACRITNAKFRAWSRGEYRFTPEVERVLHSASQKISEVLGDAPSLSEIKVRFGPGSTTQTQKRMACLAMKLKDVPACSTNMAAYADGLLSQIRCLSGAPVEEAEVEIHLGKLQFVNKTAKEHRPIIQGCALNGLYQLGLGDIIAERLEKRTGISIWDQSRNQRAALYGSVSGHKATIDLTSASDMIAYLLVDHLVSPDWFDLLWLFREADIVGLDGVDKNDITMLSKISSMGNGFTFPLETLIFWAISSSVVDIYDRGSHTLVYGDDIIVPTKSAVPTMRVLRELGFVPNMQKSFWEGGFRESCGKDYVFGIDVRPCFIKSRLTGADVFRLRNFYYRRGCFQRARELESLLHPSIRLRGPDGFGDGHLVDTLWVSKRSGQKKGWSGFTFETWSHSTRQLRWQLRRKFLHQAPVREPKDGGRSLSWKAKYEHLVVRVATYTTYIRGLEAKQQEERFFRPPSEFEDAGTPVDAWTTPGKGHLKRTKIYTFEPPYLK